VLISNAFAQATGQAAAATPEGPGTFNIVMMLVFFGVLWLLMIRPQMKRAKEHKAMIEALGKGDEVITGGGIAGKVVDIGDENFVRVEIAANTVIAVQKQTITTVLPKGTLKSL